MVEKLVSVKAVIERVYRRLKINEELPEDDMIEWTGEALLRIGAFSQFKTINKKLEVKNGKVELPCDFYKLVEIIHNNSYLPWKGESFLNEYFCDDCEIKYYKNYEKNYFMINSSYIYTSFNEGEICIIYLAVPTDCDGYPMVPDDEFVIDACAKYIIYNLDYIEFRKAAITDKVFNHSEREWLWAVGAARGSVNMLNTQQLESMRNVLQRLLPNYHFTNNRERRKLH